MNRIFVFIFFILGVVISSPLRAAPSEAAPLVGVDWLKANKGKPGLVLLDIRGRRDFREAHIPGSITTEYGGKRGWRIMKDGVPGMLPDIPYLENLIGSLGIGGEDRVILIPGGFGAGEVAKATRIYWTLKILGHDKVSILQGGLVAWAQARNPMANGDVTPEPKTFKARFRPELLATTKDVEKAIETGMTLIDSRSNDQFLGITKSGSIKRAGTLPGAKNIPGVWLTVNDGGVFRDAETLRRLYELAGVKTDGPAITFCNTGHWASIGWFVNSEILGNKETKLYDGSLAQWTTDAKRPVEKAF